MVTRQPDGSITLYGAPWCPDCKRSKKFLAEHRVAYRFVDIDEDRDGLAFVESAQNGGRTIPMIDFSDGTRLLEPTNEELARALGLTLEANRSYYDVVIIGGGPAGLTAAIYAAREGMEALVVERSGLGGNAGVTERLDNYPGFPDGIGGGELADRFVAQARRYDVELLQAVSVDGLRRDGEDVVVSLSNGQEVAGHAAIVATGSTYRRLDVPGEEDLIGAGIHFCATCDGPFYRGKESLAVIGGGNSGCEEALFLTQFVDKVVILQHGPELTASQLLVDKVSRHPKIEVRTNVAVKGFQGSPKLEAIELEDRTTGQIDKIHPAGAFVFIGLDPNTGFLRGVVDLDDYGFVVTDQTWQTSMEGVYAAGDMRAGATKQLAAAVGEGVTALLNVRAYLQKHHHLMAVAED